MTWAEQNISLLLPAIFPLLKKNIVKTLAPGTRDELWHVSQVKEGAKKEEEEVEIEKRGDSLEGA